MKILITAGLGSILALAACGATTPAPTTVPTAGAQATAAPATAAPPTQPAATAAAASPTTAPVAGPARKFEFTATNDLYTLEKLDAAPGERITFLIKHEGDEKHNLVGVGDGISIVSPDIDGGATIEWTWTAPLKAGPFKLVCAYHPAIPPILVTVK